MSDKAKSVIEEALIEYNQVVKEAQEFAKEEMIKSMPDKFESLIEEHLNKKNKLNETDDNKEPILVDTQESAQESTKDKNKELNETFDMTDAPIDQIEEMYDNMSLDEIEIVKDDEFSGGEEDIQIDDIQGEIDSMSEMIDSLTPVDDGQSVSNEPAQTEADPYSKLKEISEEMSKMIEAMEAEKVNGQLKETFRTKMKEMWGESFENELGVAECERMFETWKTKQSASAEQVNEIEVPAEGEVEKPVEEGHGVSLSHNKRTGQESQPSVDGAKSYAKNRVRLALQKENEDKTKRIAAILKENKELTKKLNTVKKQKAELVGINEGFKKTLNEMKDTMKKMAVFNSNISHVNNLLVNENLALTKDEKVYVINKFKNVQSVDESKSTHKALFEEFSSSKKKINESVENIISENVAGGSSANILESKIVEKTALDAHVGKMKNIIKYVETRRK